MNTWKIMTALSAFLLLPACDTKPKRPSETAIHVWVDGMNNQHSDARTRRGYARLLIEYTPESQYAANARAALPEIEREAQAEEQRVKAEKEKAAALERQAQREQSQICADLVQVAEKSGAIRAGTVDRSGAVIMVDHRWPNMTADMQKFMAECVSHYMAGGPDKWAKKIVFRNQRLGVTYGVMEGTRYRLTD